MHASVLAIYDQQLDLDPGRAFMHVCVCVYMYTVCVCGTSKKSLF